MNTDGTSFHTCKECHKTESLWNHTTTDHREGEQLEDRRSVGASSCNCGDGTDQRVQSLMFMMMTMNFSEKRDSCSYQNTRRHAPKLCTKLHRVKSKNAALLHPREQQTICPYLINLTYFCQCTLKLLFNAQIWTVKRWRVTLTDSDVEKYGSSGEQRAHFFGLWNIKAQWLLYVPPSLAL